MPAILMSIWMAVMPFIGAGHLEVHVAQEVLKALNIGQHDDLAGLRVLDQAHGHAGHRRA